VSPEEFVALDGAAREAVVIGLLARNGIEHLHADGAFDDSQAPALNRLLRQEAYQAAVAAEGAADEALLHYLLDLSEEGHPEADDDMRLQCITGAVARAVHAFAAAEGIDDATRDRLTETAQLGVLDEREYEAMTGTPFGLQLLLSCVRDWETPELSAEFRALLGC
jgi:hypothetical protein